MPSGATTTVNLDDLRTTATLRSRNLINQGTTLISGTGNGLISARFTLDTADIDNQGDFELRSNNQSNVVLDCAFQDCGNFFNRSGATLRLNDLQGIAVVGPGLTALNNAGLVELVHGCGQINPPGVDTGTYRYDSNCTLAFFTRPDTERVFESTLVLDPVNSSGLQLGGSLRVNGAARSFGYLIIDNTATLFGPAAITFTSTTEWRGLIEGTSGSETVTVAPGATLADQQQSWRQSAAVRAHLVQQRQPQHHQCAPATGWQRRDPQQRRAQPVRHVDGRRRHRLRFAAQLRPDHQQQRWQHRGDRDHSRAGGPT
ncbi:MAG: hypothetical protein IPO66_17105 [Rhodanobacteraceae bacterium]|nr:hypothetical protein [Rhodanobacteraceae bacterium]